MAVTGKKYSKRKCKQREIEEENKKKKKARNRGI